MKNDVIVVVGTGQRRYDQGVSQDNIITALEDKGYVTKRSNHFWPCDQYVQFQNRYVPVNIPDKKGTNYFGEGGFIQIGDGYLIISDNITIDKEKEFSLPSNPSEELMRRVILGEAQEQYPGARIHIAPTGQFKEGRKAHSHIDMYTALFPAEKLLLVDFYHGNNIGFDRRYEQIAEQEGLKLIWYDGEEDGVWYPLNIRVLPTDGINSAAVIDRKSRSLARILNEHGIEVIKANIPQLKKPQGKIHCQTNIFNPNDNVDIEKLLCETLIEVN